MRFKILNTRSNICCKLFTLCFLLTIFGGCKKADSFYEKLNTLPQVDVSKDNAYKSAYIVGDLMIVTGKLQPKNDLQITIGGIVADIVKTETNGDGLSDNKDVHLDKVTVQITQDMVGSAREVKITTGGYSTLGPAIDVFTYGGEGSFNSNLTSTQIATLASTYIFLNCVNGKGDVYYYAPNTTSIWHIKKDGTKEQTYDLSSYGIRAFLAGAVDIQGKYLYYSVQVLSGYELYRINLTNQHAELLNHSSSIAAPYEGAISAVKMIVTGIYPDSKGNLYLAIGQGVSNYSTSFLPDAIARYDATADHITYLYKYFQFSSSNVFPGMPGVKINAGNIILSLRYSPDENLLYALERGTNSEMIIEIFSLASQIKLQQLITSNTANDASQYDVVAPFSGLHISMGAESPEKSFGFLPMPGKRLQVLLYQSYNQSAQNGFPKWIVFDFAGQRTYGYATGKFQMGASGEYIARATDELLNYDEAGNLYFSANGKSYLIKTQAQ